MLPDDYLPVILFVIIGILFPIVTFYVSRFFRPNIPTLQKYTTYECGETPEGEGQIQFNFQYYIFALIFVACDVIAVFLLLWALVFTSLSTNVKLYTTIFVIIFVGVIMFGVYYALKREKYIWI